LRKLHREAVGAEIMPKLLSEQHFDIFLAGLALIVAASEIGRLLGVRVGKQGGDNVSTLEAAVLGLLAIDRSNALQEALWQQAAAVSAKDSSMVPTGLFIQTLNDTWTSEITGMIRQCSSSRTSTGSPSNRERRSRGSVSSPSLHS
jgi:hypothetical protein